MTDERGSAPQTLGDVLDEATARLFATAYPDLQDGDEVAEHEAIPRLISATRQACASGDEAACALLRSWQWEGAERALADLAEAREIRVMVVPAGYVDAHGAFIIPDSDGSPTVPDPDSWGEDWVELGDGTIPGAPVVPATQTRGQWLRTFARQVIPELGEDWEAGPQVVPGMSIPEATTRLLAALDAAKDQDPLALDVWRYLTGIAPLATAGHAPVNVRWVEERVVAPSGLPEELMREKRDGVLAHVRLSRLHVEISGRSLARAERMLALVIRVNEHGYANLGEAIAAGVVTQEEVDAADDIVHRPETALPK